MYITLHINTIYLIKAWLPKFHERVSLFPISLILSLILLILDCTTISSDRNGGRPNKTLEHTTTSDRNVGRPNKTLEHTTTSDRNAGRSNKTRSHLYNV